MKYVRNLFLTIGAAGIIAALIGIFTFNLWLCIAGGIGTGICLMMLASIVDESEIIRREARRRIRREDIRQAAEKYEDDVLKEMARMRESDNG